MSLVSLCLFKLFFKMQQLFYNKSIWRCKVKNRINARFAELAVLAHKKELFARNLQWLVTQNILLAILFEVFVERDYFKFCYGSLYGNANTQRKERQVCKCNGQAP